MSPNNSTSVAEAAKTISADCLAARTRLLHRTVTGIFNEALRPLGLTDAQLTMLVMVANRGPVSPGAVARHLNMEKSTMSRNIARMETNGWLKVDDGQSGREQELTLSAKGKALVVEAFPTWNEAQTQVKAVLGKRGAASVSRLGQKIWSQIGRE